MSKDLPSCRQNPSTTSANINNSSGPGLGEAGRSGGRSLLLIIVALLVLVSAHPWAKAQTPATVGQFAPLMNWPNNPTHAVLLPNGTVFWWPSFSNGDEPQIWNPATSTNTPATAAGYDIFCGGHSLLPNGQVLVTGGDSTISTGVANASIYDPVGGTWTFLPDMNEGRWYPTNTVLANGDTVITSGEISPLLGNDPLPQVWQVASGTWRNLTTAELDLALYPEMYLLPNGLLFMAGPSPTSRFLNTDGTGAWTTGPNSEYGNRVGGPSVMYNNGQVMIIGGGGPTATAEIINLNAPVPTWSYTGSMANARRNANATLLPDGTILVTGGTSGAEFDDYTHAVYPDELWNPATGTWSVLASLSVYRGYHSVALLLPNGQVLSGGGQCYGDPGCNPNSAEIFSPPYLFAGPPPTITSAPATINGGQTFFVGTPDAANITQVTWIRLGAVTHTFNMEQRISFLSFSQATGGLNVTAPPSANLAPPGYYMLFILASGVPSVASIIQVDNSSFAQSGPAVSVSQTALSAYAAAFVGTTSGSKPVQLTNLGTTPVTINSITTGPDFTVTSNTCGTQLAPGSCTINVAFKPTTTGQLNEVLTISDSDSSSPQTVGLSGIGEALKSAASSVNFGNEPVGATSTSIPVTLTNLGTGPIAVSSIVYSNPEFSQYLTGSSCGSSIPGLSSCQVSSVFTPNAPGTQSGTLSIIDSDPSSPTTISLSGAGAALSFSPNYIGFGNEQIPNTHVPPVSITVTNAGSASVSFSSIAIGGADPGDFAIQTNTCGAAVAANSNCVVGVTFTPQAVGVRSATLSFTDSSAGSPQTVGLAGHGVAEPSSVVVSSSNNPSTFGQSVTFTATVKPSAATGTVQFLDGGSVLGTGTVSAGTASFATSSLTTSANIITAAYSGDSIHASSTSAAITQTVNQATSSTLLSANINPATAGQAVTFTATVSPSTATGTVQFVDVLNGAPTVLGTATLSSGTAALTIALSSGTNSITAVYSGDTNDTPSTSAPLAETVN
jgi:hypothetical protein